MAPPESRIRRGGATLHLLGTVPGFVPDGRRVRAAIGPDTGCVALGVPPEDVAALAALHEDPGLASELPELDEWSARRLELLEAFGPTALPSPDLAAAYDAARAAGAEVEGIDLDDLAHTDAHTSRLKLRHIVRMNRRRNRLLGQEFVATDAYDLARQWDDAEHALPPLQAIQDHREAHMAQRLEALASRHAAIVAVLPAARFAGVTRLLGERPPATP